MSVLSSVLEIAIVLAAIYVTLSCVCSAVNEQIAAFGQLRGKTLYEGVLNLLVGHQALTDAIFKHPLIAAASDDRNGKLNESKHYRPSYVDARNFSMAFWHSMQQQLAAPGGGPAAQALAAPVSVLDDLKARVDAMPASDLKSALIPLVYAADGDYQKLLAATDGWFNAQMDRVSGWYKRRTQAVLAGIAAVIVLLSGIDSVEIGNKLYFDQNLRATVVDAIARAVPQGSDKDRDLSRVATTIDTQMQGALAGFFHPITTLFRLGVSHVLGMGVTFLALLLGGPFWFDALCGLVNVRLAGRKPERSDLPPK